ncbi:MAG: DUF99 family protein [Candidatus Hadarchaeota archaeon]
MNKFASVKTGTRIIGFDDGSFDSNSDKTTCLVGVVTRGGDGLDGVLVRDIEIDGMDLTSTLVGMINGSRHKEQLQIIMTYGITFGGFNILDTKTVYNETGLPIIVVSRKKPDMESVKEALKNLPDWKRRWNILKNSGELTSVKTGNFQEIRSTIYIQTCGIDGSEAKEIVKMSSTRSAIPEPIRLAHIISTGISRGESVGRV